MLSFPGFANCFVMWGFFPAEPTEINTNSEQKPPRLTDLFTVRAARKLQLAMVLEKGP